MAVRNICKAASTRRVIRALSVSSVRSRTTSWEEVPYLLVGAPPLLIQLAKPGAAVDRAEVGIRLSPDPGVMPIVGCPAIFDALDLPRAEGLGPIRCPRVGNRRRHPFNGIKMSAENS